jgi:hypothetical protein
MKTVNGLKMVAFAALSAIAMTSVYARPLENGTGWNGTGWNGTGWNGTGWNGTGWNGSQLTHSESERMTLSIHLVSLASQPLQ